LPGNCEYNFTNLAWFTYGDSIPNAGCNLDSHFKKKRDWLFTVATIHSDFAVKWALNYGGKSLNIWLFKCKNNRYNYKVKCVFKLGKCS
jgi:hypothetical protein